MPVDKSVLGRLSADFVPTIKQFVVSAIPGKTFDSNTEFEKVLYSVRREIQVQYLYLYPSELLP